MTYEGPEKRQRASAPEKQFEQEVEGLTRRVLTENLSLAEIRVVRNGTDGEKLIQAVQQRVIRLFLKIKCSQRALGDTSLIPAIRKRIMRLYNVRDGQLGTPGEMVAVVPPPSEPSTNGSPSSQRVLPQDMERQLFFFGKLYLSFAGLDYFEKAKEALLNKFIMRCENEQQQQHVADIVDYLLRTDLTFVGMCKGFSVIQIDSEVLDQLNIASLLTEEDLQSSS